MDKIIYESDKSKRVKFFDDYTENIELFETTKVVESDDYYDILEDDCWNRIFKNRYYLITKLENASCIMTDEDRITRIKSVLEEYYNGTDMMDGESSDYALGRIANIVDCCYFKMED